MTYIICIKSYLKFDVVSTSSTNPGHCKYYWTHLLGVCWESALSVLGVCWECAGSVLGVCSECAGTLGFLAKISFTPLLYHPGRCLGCPEKQTS